MKTLSKREITDLYDGDGIQYRSQNMWTGVSQIEKEQNIELKNLVSS